MLRVKKGCGNTSHARQRGTIITLHQSVRKGKGYNNTRNADWN